MMRANVRHVAGTALLALAMVGATGGIATAAEDTTCSYDRRTKKVSLDIGRASSAMIYVWKGTIQISAASLNDQCGRATTRNTDSIFVTATPEFSEYLTIDLRNGPLAPGSAREPGLREIEISVDLGGTQGFFSEELIIEGTPQSDTFAIGQDGISLNGDSDADLRYVSHVNEPRIKLAGEGGGDTITGQGGFGAGAPYFSAYYPLAIYGGVCCSVGATDPDGANTLTGSDSGDYILGGLETGSTISGMGGDDSLLGTWGADVISGGDGNDGINGDGGPDRIDGGNGYDHVAGNDRDHTPHGGPGYDSLN